MKMMIIQGGSGKWQLDDFDRVGGRSRATPDSRMVENAIREYLANPDRRRVEFRLGGGHTVWVEVRDTLGTEIQSRYATLEKEITERKLAAPRCPSCHFWGLARRDDGLLHCRGCGTEVPDQPPPSWKR